MSINTEIIPIAITLASLACDLDSSKDFTSSDSAEAGQLAQLEQTVQEDLVTTDENGNVTDLKGFEPSPKLNDEEGATDQELREMYQNDEDIFEFTPPEGIQAEFSPPNMITGSALLLTDTSQCNESTYQNEEPGYKEIIDYADSANICGLISLDFCIRMIPEGTTTNLSKDSYVYTKTPSMSLDIPCRSDSFLNLSIAIAEGIPSTESSSENIKISAKSSVLEIFLTNTPDCSSGGQWEAITSELRQWELEFIDNQASVYAKFKDRFGSESECVSDSIQYGPKVDACFVNETNYQAENIVLGVKIGNLEGSANLGYPICTLDGETGCIVQNSFYT